MNATATVTEAITRYSTATLVCEEAELLDTMKQSEWHLNVPQAAMTDWIGRNQWDRARAIYEGAKARLTRVRGELNRRLVRR